jgi:hypothetical protein
MKKFIRFNQPLQAENASKTMSSYLTLIAFMMFTVSPVLVPLIITMVHTIGDWRRMPALSRPAINPEHRTADLV